MAKFCVIVFIFVFAANINAQTDDNLGVKDYGTPIIKTKDGKVVEILNMLGEVEGEECRMMSKPVTGTVGERDFDKDEVMITAFMVLDEAGSRTYFNINRTQMRKTAAGKDFSDLSSFLTVGAKVRVVAYQCIGAGRKVFKYAEAIKAL